MKILFFGKHSSRFVKVVHIKDLLVSHMEFRLGDEKKINVYLIVKRMANRQSVTSTVKCSRIYLLDVSDRSSTLLIDFSWHKEDPMGSDI